MYGAASCWSKPQKKRWHFIKVLQVFGQNMGISSLCPQGKHLRRTVAASGDIDDWQMFLQGSETHLDGLVDVRCAKVAEQAVSVLSARVQRVQGWGLVVRNIHIARWY